jgi:hypothetical protein
MAIVKFRSGKWMRIDLEKDTVETYDTKAEAESGTVLVKGADEEFLAKLTDAEIYADAIIFDEAENMTKADFAKFYVAPDEEGWDANGTPTSD